MPSSAASSARFEGMHQALVISDFLLDDCLWPYYLSLFGHELERSRLCLFPGLFEFELAIPSEDPTTSSMWLVDGRDLNLF